MNEMEYWWVNKRMQGRFNRDVKDKKDKEKR